MNAQHGLKRRGKRITRFAHACPRKSRRCMGRSLGGKSAKIRKKERAEREIVYLFPLERGNRLKEKKVTHIRALGEG